MPALAPLRGRYAPSPTGELHLGNLRTALLAWLFTRIQGGRFVLRIEDLDQPRVNSHATQQIITDLRWLGLDWDEGPDLSGPFAPYTQSERFEIYQHYLECLQASSLVYPCYCSRAELAHAATAPQQGAGDGSRYPGTCRQLTSAQRRRHEAAGRRPSLRIHIPDEYQAHFIDLLAGPQQQSVQQVVGDFILRRADGIFAYQFAVVVDDGLMRINQVVRGIDLLPSTARQIFLFQLLRFPIPTFAHVPLMVDSEGKRLSKRSASAGLAPLREAGYSAAEVIGQLAASCGLAGIGEIMTPSELILRYPQPEYDIITKLIQ
ncbi:glutamyl-Q tRNA(Asp) synthetase [Tengunoibacter tsumagoiensis]|uniref:Glutamyl-Q tRNA(Asp) synthetase n=2 Tax=Tengunoibacter tsumagoiensis TaxID=2014871 RepID=A0A402A2I7_9CHLR|nr:glutamyl-Q tRNA(Asp) synthetase [Tengunoibacter tsumagoiensis]